MATRVDEETGEILETPADEESDALEDGMPDVSPEEVDDPEPEPDAAPLSEKEIEAALRKLDSEATRHANRVSEIMGADAQTLLPCAMCEPNIPGFLFPESITDEKRATVMEALGVGAEQELVDDPGTVTCDYCKGNGQTITGSHVANQVTRPCPQCNALGWQSTADLRRQAIIEETQAVADDVLANLPAAPAPPMELPPADQYGRPRGHEFYGRNVVYMTPDERARDWPGAQ